MDALVVNNLTKIYHKKVVINSISFNVSENTTVVFLGMDDSGKTTLINMLANILKRSSGEITYNKTYNFMPNALGLSEHLTVFENLYIMAKACGFKRDEAKEIIDRLSNKYNIMERYDDKVKTLSVSIKRIVSFVMMLLNNPEIIFLDEPIKNVDVKVRRIILDSLKELKKEKTIIITSELPDVALELADDLYILNNGSIKKIDTNISVSDLEKQLIDREGYDE